MKKRVKTTHEEGPREREEENISPPRKTTKTDDLSSGTHTEKENDEKMAEAPKEEKEVSEANKEEEVLSLRRRIYDQNQRLYNLEQEKETLKEELYSIKQKAYTEVKDLEEYIQQDAQIIREKVKKLETTIVQQIEVIDRQNEEIEHMAQQVTKEVTRGGAQEVAQEVAQEAAQEAAIQEAAQEVADPTLQWHTVAASGRQAPRQNNVKRTVPNWDCEECSYQTTEEKLLKDHVKSMHRITCFTCQEMFISFSKMIEHRRVNHPSNKKCNKFPYCERGERCLYKHEGEIETAETQRNQTQEGLFSCRTCNEEFSDKNDMMMHRKDKHLQEVKACKNIKAGLNCWKGPVNCWYRHDSPSASTLQNNIAPPAFKFKLQNFPVGPTPQAGLVGQEKIQLQLIQQTLQQQQQQMNAMMTVIMSLKK